MYIEENTVEKTRQQMLAAHGQLQAERIQRGVDQVASLWKSRDGNAAAFTEFCMTQFMTDPAELDAALKRFETNLESLYGHLNEIERDFMTPMHLDIGPMLPVDYQFAEYSLFAHVNDDMFKTKIAFTALLNFPLYTLEERIEKGPAWTRKDWAAARLTENFMARVPADVEQRRNEAYVKADDYISNYNIYMHHVIDGSGNRPFRQGLKLISHWGLRDELKAQYAYPDGLKKQEMIQSIMEHIIRQDIPAAVIDNPSVDWNPAANTVVPSAVSEVPESRKADSAAQGREPDTRYAHLLQIFRAEQNADPYYPTMPTKIDRRFQRDREIPEEQVRELFVSVLTSDEIKQTARLIESRLGRKLKPFDIWYDGFKARGHVSEESLDAMVGKKYPDIHHFQAGLPEILKKLGFDRDTAAYLAGKIIVDPARGSGHAMGAARRADNAHLRTRFAPGSPMNYKGYNIALHELGHNVEQVFSLSKIDWVLLNGVPNTAFTEAFAFVFQGQDLDVLGVSGKNDNDGDLRVLDMLWSTFEIGSVSLVDMAVWHWMYDHPEAKPAELREAVIEISKSIWNEYMAPVFGIEDQILLGVYSHMIDAGLYLPDYPLGFIIAYQIEDYLRGRNLGEEMERMCTLGRITPDAWMQAAVNSPISTEPMLRAAGKALEKIQD
ncbi:hypothetical protein JW948_05070 [bacterium]|nr:hypothetical protein [bacterium]